MKIKIVDPRPAEKHGLLTETMASPGLKKKGKGVGGDRPQKGGWSGFDDSL